MALFTDWVWLREERWAEDLDWLMPELGKWIPEEEMWWEGGWKGGEGSTTKQRTTEACQEEGWS